MTAKTDLDRNPGAPNGRAIENPAEAKAGAPEKGISPQKQEPKLYSSLSSPHIQTVPTGVQNTVCPLPRMPEYRGCSSRRGSLMYSLNSISRPEPSAVLSFLYTPVVWFGFFHLILETSLPGSVQDHTYFLSIEKASNLSKVV